MTINDLIHNLTQMDKIVHAQVNPLPKAMSNTLSFFFKRPELKAWSKAKGMLAEEVLP